MSDTYTKLFRSIVASTIVSEPLATRWLWVTMLSQSDSSGIVRGSIPGLARLANITLEECEAALKCFYSPDPYSRTQDDEGRRIEVVPDGWRLLNHAKYDAIRSAGERAEYKRNWDRKNRPSGHDRTAKPDSPTDSPTHPDNSPTKPDSPAAVLSSQFSVLKKQDQKTAPKGDLFPGIDPQIVADFKALRNKQRAPITQTALAGIQREADKAGLSLEAALRTCCENSWRGFKAVWITDAGTNNSRTGHVRKLSIVEQVAAANAEWEERERIAAAT